MHDPQTEGALLRALEQNSEVLREIAHRYLAPDTACATAGGIHQPEDAHRECIDMVTLGQEQVRVLLLNTKKKLIRSVIVYQGTVDRVAMRPAELLRPAILENAPSMVVVHNHPSGDCAPSSDDIAITRRLRSACEIMDIELVDHVIVARNGFCSLHRRGLGFA